MGEVHGRCLVNEGISAVLYVVVVVLGKVVDTKRMKCIDIGGCT